MARKLRIQYSEAVCQVMNRGDRREAIFAADPGLQIQDELLAQVSEVAGPEHRGPEVRENAKARAEGIVSEELEQLGCGAAELAARRKGDPEKLRFARRLRRESTMTLAWTAGRLRMGVQSHLACRLHRIKRNAAREATNENSVLTPSRL